MANANSTTTTRTLARAPIKAKVKVCEVMPAYGASNGVLSFRYGLRARERNLVDRALEIVGGCLRQPGAALASPDAVKQYLRLHLAGEGREVFAVLFLDVQNRVTAFEIMFIGTLTQTSVYPREVVLAAMGHGAASVIFAHNHPSGGLNPSQADDGLNRTLINALALVDVRVLDHIIISNLGALSMLEQGLMPVRGGDGRVSLTA
jgi:DNA repair protein RadC